MPQETTLRIVGMHCGACAARVEQALRGVEGVRDAVVQLLGESARITLNDPALPTGRLVAAVRAAGYDAEPAATGREWIDRFARDDETREKLRRHRQNLIIAWMYALPILGVDHFMHMLWPASVGSQVAARLMQFVLLGMLFFSPAGSPILVGGLRGMLHRTWNMDVLISLGVLTATFSSLYGVFVARDESFVHLHAAAMILGVVCIGRYLETHARGRATSAMKALAKRAPRTALVERNGRLVETAVEDIAPGERLHVPSQNTIPTDGIIREGAGDLDESLMTGESMPVSRDAGARVLGGTFLLSGALVIEATSVGDASAIGRILQLVAQAQASRTQMQRTADRISAIFTPIILAATAVTFIGWIVTGGRDALADAARASVAVLVVACPCALGLATPTVVAVASGLAALRGILVRDAAMLESLAGIDTVVWDKTGTLTFGLPTVHRIEPMPGWDEPTVLRLAASAEQLSSHPIGKSLEAHARRQQLNLFSPTRFEQVPGGGVMAVVDRHEVLVGGERFLRDHGIDAPQESSEPGRLDQFVGSRVWVAVDRQPAAWIILGDTLRPASAAAVARLSRLGIMSELLSGDAQPTVRAVAKQVGIETATAGCTPGEKVRRITTLKTAGRKVAMVGDGINDAAALAAAHVGIAFAAGAEAASEAAGIQLIGSSPRLVADTVDLARGSLRVIRQNLFWAFIYNLLMVPLAAVGVLPPWAAAAAMMASSLTVVLNALRLKGVIRWQREPR